MKLERTFQISVATMAAMGTLLLGIGQGSVFLPAVAIFVGITSVYFTDVLGWIRLNRTFANVAGTAAVLLAVLDFYRLERESQLLAIANLLVYLQIVLLYQKKDARIYWQLFMLSLLQVVVSAALNFDFWFGGMLIVYLFVTLIAMALFYIYRETAGPSAETLRRDARAALRSAKAGDGVFLRELHSIKPADRPADYHLWQNVTAIGLFTMLLTGVVFFGVPRKGDNRLAERGTAQRVVGFSDTVSLGELGSALENPENVMQVRLIDPETDQPLSLSRPPLFRGTVLDVYHSRPQASQWSLSRQRGGDIESLERPPADTPFVLQKIVLEPLRNEDTVFSIYPAHYVGRAYGLNPGIKYDPSRERIRRVISRQRSEFTLGTTGVASGRQLSLIPVPASRRLEARDRKRLLQLPSPKEGVDPLARLKAEASRVVDESGLPQSDPLGRARALERYFKTDPQFEYSLEGQPRDPELDPIEDFVVNLPRGHCEYFASALALMLRSQGIPARIVVGFKGGQYNNMGGFYQIRQLHAHSWVEVYLEEEHVRGELFNQARTGHGGWLTLDPTPDGEEGLGGGLTLAERARELADYTEYLWLNYVVGLDAHRQEEAIYGPLSKAGSFFKGLFAKTTWTETIPALLGRLFSRKNWEWIKGNWFSWRGGLFAVVSLLAAVVLWRATRWLYRRLAAAFAEQRRGRRSRSGVTIEFYLRFESLLVRHGLSRPESQTPHEFALAVGGQFAGSPPLAPAAALPRKIVDVYYRVRYGGGVLGENETRSINADLARLARSLGENSKSREGY